jgi:hypothetical protein
MEESLVPHFGCQWQLVELGARLAPSWVVLGHQGKKSLAVRGLDHVDHLMHDDVFQQVLRLLHELGVKSDIGRLVVAAAPFCLHALKEVA